ncbi:hypothetical protein BOVMAS37_10480 [Streptococcus uberis]|uniref:hypothetical protein n=1 Tax=Streptococcus uberis TaxID=1349 RepID=UPI0027DB0769|nr:hypothetical protein [Streptococcus uberis]MCK1257307.1 hypothetical protein [Streptococcus uberis]MCK1258964.1 hypothetical protein [Streptococcus uberis]
MRQIKLLEVRIEDFLKGFKMKTSKSEFNGILNLNNYKSLVVETDNHKKIAEITANKVTSANGYVVRLIPNN